ncbi:MAG: AtpZ/AtpI family protein [Proteobacteria bacterium]|nr:AtpZ/AtpI family protein [Pseudomonadota bacterium]
MDKEKGRLKRHTNVASIGINLVAATFIGLAIGLYLDKLFSTAPWMMIIFLLFGIAAGFKNMFAQAKKYGLLDDDFEDGNGDG